MSEIEKHSNPVKFNLHVMLMKLTSRKFWVWLISTYFVQQLLHNGESDTVKVALVIVWCIMSILYFIGEPLENAFATMVSNAKISAEFKAGVSKDIKEGGK